MRYSDVARFEFRVFGTDLAPVRDKLAERAAGACQPPSHETYIVSRLNAGSNVKIRGERLEVKGLQGKLRALEQWMPIFKKPFPVAASDIENVIAPAFGIDVDLGDAPPFSEATLLAWVDAQPPLTSIGLVKERTTYDIGECDAEFTQLQIGFERLHTVAIEAPDPKDAEALVREAGLEGAENVGYSLYLQRRLF